MGEAVKAGAKHQDSECSHTRGPIALRASFNRLALRARLNERPGAAHQPLYPGAAHQPLYPGAAHQPLYPGAAHQHPVLPAPAVLVRRAPLSSADIGRFALQNGVRYVQYDLRLFTLIYAHEARTGAKFAPSFAIRGKTCGPMGRRPTFCWGPSTRSANSRCGANFPNSPVGARSASTNLWELAARAQTCGSSRREHKNFRKFQVSLPQISTCKLIIPYISFYFYCHVPPKIAKNCRTWHKF